ncbi:hypothetical protein CLOM_g3872 [Closterium sp. NIES-68]|nr:hypothetical protein CLOM_g3872 [Closterium sp. NIES-68]GJP66844.1 hypothetical protein CLOP_g23732 [Closterium sp. NIES-67]
MSTLAGTRRRYALGAAAFAVIPIIVALGVLAHLALPGAALAPQGAGSRCDLTTGEWRRGTKGFPRYTSLPGKPNSCPYVRSDFSCERNGRSDMRFQWYRWQPIKCLYTYFSPSGFKYMLKGKKVLLVGDSMMSNFYEALLCAIHIGGFKGEPYQRNTAGVFSIKGVHFPRMNISVEHLFSPYLVYAITRGTVNGKGGHGYDVHVDKIHPTVAKILPEYAMAVFASGVWWQQNVPRRKQPNVFFVNNSPKNLSNLDAHAWALNTLSSFIKGTNYGGVPYFISFSPHHGGAGSPQKGVYQDSAGGTKPSWVGACGAVKPTSEQAALKDYRLSLPTSEAYMTTQKTALLGSPLRFLQVTSLSAMRPDAHQGPWFKRRASTGPGSPSGNGESPFSGDCTHWCLPGVPDAWVDMMYSSMLLEPSLAGLKK